MSVKSNSSLTPFDGIISLTLCDRERGALIGASASFTLTRSGTTPPHFSARGLRATPFLLLHLGSTSGRDGLTKPFTLSRSRTAAPTATYNPWLNSRQGRLVASLTLSLGKSMVAGDQG